MDREHNRTPHIEGFVAEFAEVTGNTLVADEASVTDGARVHGCFDSRYGYAVRIRNHAKVSDYARVRSSNTFLYGHAEISGHAGVWGDVQVGNDAVITGNASVYGVENYILGNARIEDHVSIGSNVLVSGDSLLSGHFHITDATIRGNAEIFEHQHFLTLRYFEGPVTLHRTKGGGALVNAGCQSFGLDESREWYEGLAHVEGWVLPGYWENVLQMFRDHAEAYF